MNQYEKTEATEDTPQFVKDCLKAVKEGVHTKGDQDGMCWALYNKHKKDNASVTFKVEMLEMSNPIEQKLFERGHSDPEKGSKNIIMSKFPLFGEADANKAPRGPPYCANCKFWGKYFTSRGSGFHTTDNALCSNTGSPFHKQWIESNRTCPFHQPR